MIAMLLSLKSSASQFNTRRYLTLKHHKLANQAQTRTRLALSKKTLMMTLEVHIHSDLLRCTVLQLRVAQTLMRALMGQITV